MKEEVVLKTIKPISYEDVVIKKSQIQNGHKTNGHQNVVGAPSTILEPPNTYRSRWRSIRVMYLTMFLSSVSFSICMSSLWPYLKLLDSGANTDFLGWVVASYSVGQLLASPVFGAWATYRKKSREPLVVSMVVNVIANVLYSYLESIPSDKSVYLIVSRSLVGFGAGNVAVVRSYVAGATTLKERTSAMANMSAFQAVGFIIGPVIQIAMVPIGYPGPVHIKSLHLDFYTSPAILSAIVGVINIILLFAVFSEHRVDNDEDINFSVQDSGGNIETTDYKPDTVAVISSISLFFVILFIFAVFETIGTPLTMHMYSWTKSNATLYNGIILGSGGVISIIVFIGIKILSKRVNERYILLGGLILCMFGFFVYLPWGHNYPSSEIASVDPAKTKPPNTTDWTTSSNITSSWTDTTKPHNIMDSVRIDTKEINSYKVHSDNDIYNMTDYPIIPTTTEKPNNHSKEVESVGCPDSYKWCSYTPIVTFAQFLLGTLLIVIGYPTCNVMTYTLYSKILGPKPQGMMMGWLTASGSLARTVGPVFVSQVYNAYGPRVTFVAMVIVVFLSILMFIGVFKKLVPFKFSTEIKTISQI